MSKLFCAEDLQKQTSHSDLVVRVIFGSVGFRLVTSRRSVGARPATCRVRCQPRTDAAPFSRSSMQILRRSRRALSFHRVASPVGCGWSSSCLFHSRIDTCSFETLLSQTTNRSLEVLSVLKFRPAKRRNRLAKCFKRLKKGGSTH